jgi:6-phosphogluconolactonase
MGDDGHSASLFPGTRALDEKQKWVAAVFVDKLQSWRLSLTLPVINNAARVLVLVSGEQKAQTLYNVFHAPKSHYPIQAVQPVSGLTWYVDEAAAARL